LNDAKIFELIKSGNKSEFDKLFRSYYQDLCRFAIYLSCSPENAEEVVQDLFFKIWENKKSLKIHTSAKSYLFTSVRNSVYNLHKHQKVKDRFIEHSKAASEIIEDENHLDAEQEMIIKINNAIELMPEKRREVFKLSKVEGYKYKEIAEKLNISVKTVENHMGEALKFLRTNLNKQELLFLFILLDFLAEYYFSVGVFNNLIVN